MNGRHETGPGCQDCGALANSVEAWNQRAELERLRSPIKMILFCPKCGKQHIDTANETWDNPPHRSHQCQYCGFIWRPADVPTEGVKRIGTVGKADAVDFRGSVDIERLRSPWVSVGERLPEMSAECVKDDDGALLWLTNEEGSKSTGEHMELLELLASTFPIGTRVEIHTFEMEEPDTPPPAPSEV